MCLTILSAYRLAISIFGEEKWEGENDSYVYDLIKLLQMWTEVKTLRILLFYFFHPYSFNIIYIPSIFRLTKIMEK